MTIVVVCCVLLLAGLAGAARGVSADIQPPPPPEPGNHLALAKRWIWWIDLTVLTGLASGVLVAGAGSRLVMRLLGALSPDSSQGRITEAEEIVGEIDLDGTIALIVFVGIITGLLSSALYLVLRRYLPTRWAGGLALGAGLLTVFGTRVDPLRPDNEDFDIVGPWWVAILAFSALALAQGVAVVGFANRISRWLPLVGRNRRSLAYASLILLVPGFVILVIALAIGLVYVYAHDRVSRVLQWLSHGRPLVAGRAALTLGVLVALPGFVVGLGDLVGRGP